MIDAPTKTEERKPTVQEASSPSTRTLDALVSDICQDARKDNLRYLIRSNTSHDGE